MANPGAGRSPGCCAVTWGTTTPEPDKDIIGDIEPPPIAIPDEPEEVQEPATSIAPPEVPQDTPPAPEAEDEQVGEPPELDGPSFEGKPPFPW